MKAGAVKPEAAALAAAAAAVAVGGAYLASKKRGPAEVPTTTTTTILVFGDRGASGLSDNAVTFKYAPLPSPVGPGLWRELKAAAARDLGDGAAIDGVRLFVQSTGSELVEDDDDAILASLKRDAASNGLNVPVLVCTVEGAELSPEANGRTLRKFPWPTSGIDLPFGYGYLLSFTRGKRQLPLFNGYDNLLRAHRTEIRTVRVRRFPYKEDDVRNQEYYGVDYRPHEDEGLIVTIDPDMVSEMLRRQPDFPKMWSAAGERKILNFVERGGLFTGSTVNQDWQTGHGVLPKYFNAIRIQSYYPIVLEKTQVFVREWAKLAASGGKVGHVVPDVADWFTCMTADAVVKASMDYDMRNVERKGEGVEIHRFLFAFRHCFGYLGRRGDPDALDAGGKEYRRQKDVCKEVVVEVTEKTRKGEIGGPLSFVSGMLETKASSTGEYVAMQDFYGHAINIMVAGHETTAATLGFCLAELSRHPECLAKVLEEIEGVMGERSTPTYEDIGKLQYVEACFRETLRMYPAVQALKRECATDTIVLGKYLLRKGQRIETIAYGLHRDPDQWDRGVFGDTEVWNPERFVPGAPATHPNAYVPFGFGVRACIGMQFALLEAKAFLCMMLNFFDMKTPEGFVPVPGGRGGAPTCLNLRLIVKPRPGGPMSRINLFPEAGASGAAPSAGPAKAKSAPAPAVEAKKAPAGKPLLILYGSNTGTCEDFALLLSERASDEGMESKVLTLDEALDAGLLPCTDCPVVIVTSTYNGTPPDNASKFAKWLAGAKQGGLEGMRFAVFGVGNSNWEATYQKFPTDVHQYVDGGACRFNLSMRNLTSLILTLSTLNQSRALSDAGASQIVDLAKIDVSGSDFVETFDDWSSDLLAVISLDLGASTKKAAAGTKKRATFIRALLSSPPADAAKDEVDFIAKMRQVYAKHLGMPVEEVQKNRSNMDFLKVTSSTQLQSEESGRSTCHLELTMAPGKTYESGDHLAVIGVNNDSLVNAALEAMGMTGDEYVECNPGLTAYSREIPNDLPGVPLPARLALIYLPDLSAPPSRKDIKSLADSCPCPPEKFALQKMSDEANFREAVLDTGLTLTEILTKYKSAASAIDIVDFCAMHPRMKPRYYSISSSPLVKPDRCTITVGFVDYYTKAGRYHQGLASGKIHSLTAGSKILGKVHQLNGKFKLPKDPSTPIIMVGPGTGVAPFMGFLEEREMILKKGENLGPAHLFFGCRTSTHDFIYKEKLQAYASNGVLSSDGLHVAFSREERQAKVYVQDLVDENSEEMWKLINELGAIVFICGDAKRMAPDVKKAFISAAAKHGKMSQAAAENWMGGMVNEGRYVEDVYA
ncbi:hypothetical protein ACHAWF_018524 [Thalassiosira exigua]